MPGNLASRFRRQRGAGARQAPGERAARVAQNGGGIDRRVVGAAEAEPEVAALARLQADGEAQLERRMRVAPTAGDDVAGRRSELLEDQRRRRADQRLRRLTDGAGVLVVTS
ncbi:MAG TPA: hypothetical protein VL049_10935 [Candidatus Dormibacteraeota bacterium]|nr:hypothetical protein [Candidatus Dormibacteraeota bacterium]